MIFIAVVAAYVIGSVPFGYILAKLLRGIDIRSYGSGNFGATNVYRVIGPPAGITVLILDALKGLAAVTLIGDFALARLPQLDPTLFRLALAAAAVCGHNWTFFLKFKGGKGVATTAGVLIGLSLRIPHLAVSAGISLGVWILTLLAGGLVSLASILATAALPIIMLIFHQPPELIAFAAVLFLFVLYRHKSNIIRMLRGEEKRIFRFKD